MDLLQHVASAVAPVFLLTLIGLLWRRGGWAYDTAFVTRLSMTVSIPCLIFMALVRSDVDPRLLRDTVLAATAAYVGVGAVMAIISFTFGIWVVAGGGSPLNAVREPLVWGTVLGGLFLLLGWRVPDWVGETLDLVGQMAIPLMLLTLGVAISGLRPRALGRALWLCLVKLGICVGGAPLPRPRLRPAAAAPRGARVQVASPVAVTSYMLAAKYDARPDEVAGLVVVSTLVSIPAIPLLLAFFV